MAEGQYNVTKTEVDQQSSTLEYYDVQGDESTINEHYITTIGDNEETLYLSVEDANPETFEVTLEDLQHLTIENGTVVPEEKSESLDTDGSNIVVLMPKHSNKLYGVIQARDELGDVQKYKFQFRTNEEGKLEIMEETLSLVTEEQSGGTVETKIENLAEEEEEEGGYESVPAGTSLLKTNLLLRKPAFAAVNIKEESCNNFEEEGEPYPEDVTGLKREQSELNVVQQLLYKNSHIEVQYETELDSDVVASSSSKCQVSPIEEEQEELDINEINHEEVMIDGSPARRTKYEFEEVEREVDLSQTDPTTNHDSINIPTTIINYVHQEPLDPPPAKQSTTEEFPDLEIFEKRFAKNKEAKQAKRFHQFLNRTTISYAPIRNKRLPRKQAINPVRERKDEEIIVQEVMVSSKGTFIERGSVRRNKKRYLRITATVELSDSEEEPTKQTQTDKEIIEIHSDNECNKDKPLTKRPRGRPPKKPLNSSKVHDKETIIEIDLNKEEEESVVKSKKGRPGTVIDPIKSKEIVCPHCPKTFASQNSLNTHIIHHNLENSLKNKARMSTTQTKFDYNHKCDKCGQSFKNSILLKKHCCTQLTCSVCLKTFRDVTLLNIHKKSHTKSNLVRTTSVATVTPKKNKSTNPQPTFKCPECPKVCESDKKLNVHAKTHKKFVCLSCSLNFSSKLLLDTHVRTHCVKPPGNKRLSFGVRKSFVQHTPPNKRQSVLLVRHDCDKCPMKFSTFRSLYTHKVQTHGLSTPDKSLTGTAKAAGKKYKPVAAHSGIPANDRLKRAYAALRKKLTETDGLAV
ncbi:PR domain zinc finger protein 5-like isoform X2 [Anthonomus grandis grandis]|uniref:PR domain zinc finger protein 5-like isoform X2 n=1 Tax=Anthonomus grandis grandis TaxID=2921223 RepID=UPI00216689C3|nr:PR domain zinc finger protein 5-like isoform X2 [Anthonomus grandis grandis]